VSEKLTTQERRKQIKKAERLIAKFDLSTVAGLRNRAMIGLIVYGVASIDATLLMRFGDYYRVGNRGWVRLIKDGKEHQVLLPIGVQAYMDEYLVAVGIDIEPKGWLFRSTQPGRRNPLSRSGFLLALRSADPIIANDIIKEHLPARQKQN
jgi:hypothetical protein